MYRPGTSHIVDSPKEGHKIMYLFSKDMTYTLSQHTYIIPTVHFEPPKEEDLSTKNKLIS